MKYALPVHEFSFNKIKNGTRKVGVHLFDKHAQKIKIHDVLEIHNTSNSETLECEVLGIAVFDNFNDLVDALSPQALGYKDKKEVLLRLNRIFSADAQKACNVVGFFLKKLDDEVNFNLRPELER